MKLTIEVTNSEEILQLLQIFKELNLETIRVVVDPTDAPTDALPAIRKKVETSMNLSEIKKKKGYKGVNRSKFDTLVQKINLSEPIETLIGQLNR